MIFLRFILVFVLVMYLARILIRWFLGVSGRGRSAAESRPRAPVDEYSGLTDQEIEDAEYEEIETGDR